MAHDYYRIWLLVSDRINNIYKLFAFGERKILLILLILSKNNAGTVGLTLGIKR